MSITPEPDFGRVLSESKRIIDAHSRHFLALSLLFILPTILTSILFKTLQQHLLDESNTLTITFIFIGFVQIVSVCAVGTITYSVLQGFYGRPVELISSITSLSSSFLHLLVTNIISQAVSFVGSFVVMFLLSIMVISGFAVSGYNSTYLFGFPVVVGLVFSVVWMVYLSVNWAVANVVVVAESSWGFKPLRRSTNLVRGKRWVALSLLLFFQFLMGVLTYSGSALAAWLAGGVSNGWMKLAFVVQIGVASAFAMWLMLHSIAANTVFYIYCKAMHGELASEIADGEYISLPVDDEKPLHFV
ncbi:hypothetical protein L1049_005586 [Liquidambar formosana]|uniref:Transmembrane protein n=1 Tax=Liquidambar formosana TaxID=63359 RepID=A0AAP0WT35_LIQFO